MKPLFLLTEAAVFTALGLGALYVARRAVLEDDEANEDRTAKWSIKGIAAGMAVTNAAAAFFLDGYYGLGQFDILRTLTMLCVLWACAWADAKAYIIPNRVLLIGCLAFVSLVLIEILRAPGQMPYLLMDAMIAAIALLAAAALCRFISPKAIGMGDVKLLALMGLVLGMNLVWGALFCSFLVVFFYCVFLLVTKRAKRSDSIPFAPSLLAGTVTAVFLMGV